MNLIMPLLAIGGAFAVGWLAGKLDPWEVLLFFVSLLLGLICSEAKDAASRRRDARPQNTKAGNAQTVGDAENKKRPTPQNRLCIIIKDVTVSFRQASCSDQHSATFMFNALQWIFLAVAGYLLVSALTGPESLSCKQLAAELFRYLKERQNIDPMAVDDLIGKFRELCMSE